MFGVTWMRYIIIPGAGHVDLYDRVNIIPFNKLTNFFGANFK